MICTKTISLTQLYVNMAVQLKSFSIIFSRKFYMVIRDTSLQEISFITLLSVQIIDTSKDIIKDKNFMLLCGVSKFISSMNRLILIHFNLHNFSCSFNFDFQLLNLYDSFFLYLYRLMLILTMETHRNQYIFCMFFNLIIYCIY